MSDKPMDKRQVRGELAELRRQVVALGNMVESLFADATMALIESPVEALPELREDDCRAHERCLEIEKLCTELLANGEPDPGQVRYIWAASKIVTDLKRAADAALRIGSSLRSLDPKALPSVESRPAIPRLTQLAQSMLSDALEAFVNHDEAEAGGLHLVFRELTALRAEAIEELVRAMAGGELAVPAGAALAGVAQRLEDIGNEVLDMSTQIRHLHPPSKNL
ncbi:MAG: phosphate signaling complex PhoU family protein [Planctomycetota bacterium]|jgi:phosphate transport system protein